LDLALYVRVLWRFRFLVLTGLALALAVAFLSYMKPRFDGFRPAFTHRTPTVWGSDAVLHVTERGFPWGRSRFSQADASADPARFQTLATLYAELAQSDAVQRAIPARRGEGFVVEPQVGADGSILPMLTVRGTALSPARAQIIALHASRALQAYLDREQDAARIPGNSRVELALIRQPRGAAVVDAPKKTRPVFLFMLVLIATIALAFILENVRPRPHTRTLLRVAEPPPDDMRRVEESS
jgi:hypothetical protein